MLIHIVIFLLFIQITYSYKTEPTPWLCTDSSTTQSSSAPACLPGYVIDIENVLYESTTDNLCGGITLCRIENKNALLFACNRKRTCDIDVNYLKFYINETCGSAIRLFVQYRCLPVIYEQKDYLCEASTARRARIGDINLSCERNYRLYIKTALIGISLKQQDDPNKTPFKCNKETPNICNYNVPNSYNDVCDSQLRDGSDYHCKIKYNERPILKDCPHGMTSNFSLVEYLCIPGYGINEDLPRIDICSTETPEQLTIDRGLLHSPNYPQSLGQYLGCKKQLFIPRESRFRLFMLEKSIEYSHEFNIRLLNIVQTLSRNEFIDINITNSNNGELVQFELKTNHVGGGKFLLYFQIDTRISEYAPFIFESDKTNNPNSRRGKTPLKRFWGFLIGCLLGLILVLLIVFLAVILFRFLKRRRERSLRYLKSDDDHRQRLNVPATSPDHEKTRQVEQPYLVSSSPAILPSSSNVHNRPNSASSTTSSIILHQVNDGLSDRESLIKPTDQIQSRSNALNGDIDNFYEEIKEQQHQTALALGKNDLKGDLINPYLEAKCFETKNIIFQGNSSTQPIRDHHENPPHYQSPTTPTYAEPNNTNNQVKNSSDEIPPQRMDMKSSESNATTSDVKENHN